MESDNAFPTSSRVILKLLVRNLTLVTFDLDPTDLVLKWAVHCHLRSLKNANACIWTLEILECGL